MVACSALLFAPKIILFMVQKIAPYENSSICLRAFEAHIQLVVRSTGTLVCEIQSGSYTSVLRPFVYVRSTQKKTGRF